MMLTPYTKLIRRSVALLILLSATLSARPRVAPAQGVPLEPTATPEAQLSTMPEQGTSAAAPATVAPARTLAATKAEKNVRAASTDRLIVRYRASSQMGGAFARGEAGAQSVQAAEMQRLKAQTGVDFRFVRTFDTQGYVLRMDQEMPLEAAAKLSRMIAADPSVEYAEPDVRMFPMAAPNDPGYNQQWGFFTPASGVYGANFADAWEVTTGSLGIVVAVIDSGVLPHADLAGRVLPGYDFISDEIRGNDGDGRDANASDPGNWITAAENQSGYFEGCEVRNSSWHGTHVAGTIGAASNNGIGVAGANWVSKILPVRVLGKCGGYTSDIVDGMRWAAGLSVSGVPANPNPAKVLNLSLGGYGSCSLSEQNAIDAIVAAGAVVVVAAGNENMWAGSAAPASCNKVITVAATGSAGSRAYYSNYGSEVAAPGGDMVADGGVGIYSTLNSGLTTPQSDSYGHYQGTSMAAPHVAGLASLILSVAPGSSPQRVAYLITSTARAFPTGSTCTVAACGAGIIDAGAAVRAAAATMPNNANLSGLALSAGTLAPAFVSNTTNYAASVPNAVASVVVTPTRSDANAAVVVSNAAGVCAQNRCALLVGANRITATVTAQDGATRKPYVVVVTRAGSNNANLSGLVLSAGTLAPAFVSNTTNYAASVSNTVTSVVVTATRSDANAAVIVANAAGVCVQNRCALVVGANRITATVTAQDGATRKPYVVVVTRAGSNNANLSGLVLSAGTLAPAFVSNTTNYAASVSNTVTSVVVTATRSDANAAVVVSNAAGVCAQNRCALVVGANRITATVTAQDGATRKPYVVVVTRAGSNNAHLSGLVLSAGTLAPAFVSNTTNYAASVPNAVASVVVTPTRSDANAAVVVANASGVCAQNRCALLVGANRITATVTAQDGVSRKPYVVVVTRAGSNNANLSGLVLSAGTLAPAFVSNTTNYAASVSNTVTSVIVTPTRSDVNAAVVVANASGVCAQNRCALVVGTNRITATVTAQDGVTRKAYVVVVTRAGSNEELEQRRSTVIFDMDSEGVIQPDVWNPLLPGSARVHGLHQAMMEPLFIVSAINGAIEPWLGASITPNGNADVWTLTLQQGATWNDGVPVTADDVIFSVDLLKTYPTLAGSAITNAVASMQKIDDRTVRFTLKARNTRFGVDHLSVKLWGSRVNIVPKHIWVGKDPLTFRNYQAGTSPVFSGPYKLKSFDSNGKQFLYERDDNWWGARTGFKPLPKPKYLKFVVAGNESQTVSMMAQNNLDSAMTISLSAFETLKAQNSLVIPWRATTPYGLTDACPRNLEFNTAVAPWNDAVLRRAVNYAINRSQVVHEAYADATFASVLPLPMYPALQRYTQLLVDNGAFTRHPISQSNPTAAVSLIESRGYTRGADGYFIKAGKQLTMNIISVDWAPEMAAWSQVVARQLRTVGISATVSTLTGREFYDNLYYGRFQALAGWNTCSTLHEPWDTLHTLHGKYVVPVGTFTTRNPWRWNNTAFSNAVDQMEQSTPGTATYDNAYATAMEQFLTDLPVIPMVQFMKIAPFSTKYWTNWPTSQNAYALPVTWWQSTFQILVNLQPVP